MITCDNYTMVNKSFFPLVYYAYHKLSRCGKKTRLQERSVFECETFKVFKVKW